MIWQPRNVLAIRLELPSRLYMTSHHEILLFFVLFWVFSSDYVLYYTELYAKINLVKK